MDAVLVTGGSRSSRPARPGRRRGSGGGRGSGVAVAMRRRTCVGRRAGGTMDAGVSYRSQIVPTNRPGFITPAGSSARLDPLGQAQSRPGLAPDLEAVLPVGRASRDDQVAADRRRPRPGAGRPRPRSRRARRRPTRWPRTIPLPAWAWTAQRPGSSAASERRRPPRAAGWPRSQTGPASSPANSSGPPRAARPPRPRGSTEVGPAAARSRAGRPARRPTRRCPRSRRRATQSVGRQVRRLADAGRPGVQQLDRDRAGSPTCSAGRGRGDASASLRNRTQASAVASGLGRTFSVSWAMTPSVPIEPVRSLGKS